jgi:Uma2 family endonuclease
MATVARKRWTLEAFLAFDDGTDTCYELFDGEIVAMAPPARAHGALVTRLARLIGNGLKPPCEIIAEAGIVVPDRTDSYYQAGLAVTCSPSRPSDPIIPDPVLIVEVLSPSTTKADRDRKVPDYRTMPSLQDILVVSSTQPRVEHLRREDDGFKVRDFRATGTIRLEALGVEIDVEALFAGLTLQGEERS